MRKNVNQLPKANCTAVTKTPVGGAANLLAKNDEQHELVQPAAFAIQRHEFMWKR
jgi:hypothetical protein